MRGRWEVSDAEWSVLEPILQPARRRDGRGRPWRDTGAVLNGVLWVLGTGAQWRELPTKYPPYQTCHRRFQQWVREGKLEKILRLLATELQARGQLPLGEGFAADAGELIFLYGFSMPVSPFDRLGSSRSRIVAGGGLARFGQAENTNTARYTMLVEGL
jgi:transposase